ncbi:MAG: YecA family protein [endosymbiont of Galathealinum brachiosum]|uniref:YecA family protein n=1 Tax=endosymbiont of Galathealinum brachiosum TaxID=2200906 RepID=A0A370DFG5_9GAMM|nr:MAG: YecA family protein [endosymbiont of Galathealinum brachiosum]
MISRPDYNSLTDALAKADAELVASEAHGSLCGMLCAAGTIELSKWLDQVFEVFDVNNILIKEASQLLVGLYNDTQAQLNDSEADFQLLLPDDTDSLAQRTEALASWCQGFTYGLVAGGLKKDQKLPEDTAELIKDMVEIARAGHDLGDDSESDEESFMQIYEYVRMGVLLINEELQPSHKPPEILQ